MELILTTFDWVPEAPRGFVRDLRIRWALEEVGLAYGVASVPFRQRDDDHVAHQPFGQVPWLVADGRTIFESGAILLFLGERSEALLPGDPVRRGEAVEWLFAALNSVEMATLPWSMSQLRKEETDTPRAQRSEAFLRDRLKHMSRILGDREWLAGGFSIADIAMADVLRLVDRFGGLADYAPCADYVRRAVARRAFQKAHADQLAHFAAAD